LETKGWNGWNGWKGWKAWKGWKNSKKNGMLGPCFTVCTPPVKYGLGLWPLTGADGLGLASELVVPVTGLLGEFVPVTLSVCSTVSVVGTLDSVFTFETSGKFGTVPTAGISDPTTPPSV